MHDFIIGRLAREHEADIMREVKRNELVARCRRPVEEPVRATPIVDQPVPASAVGHRWRHVLVRLVPVRLGVRVHRP